MSKIVSTYLSIGFDLDERKIIINRAVQRLRYMKKKYPFDAIAFRGMSGAIIAPIIADKLGVGLIIVRKDGEGSHTMHRVEGYVEARYVIVDDFIDSGNTIKQIITEISRANNSCVFKCHKCTGFYLWHKCARNDGSGSRETLLGIPGIKFMNKVEK